MRMPLVACLVTVLPVSASAQFRLHEGPALGTVPSVAAVGDLDADGAPDYAVRIPGGANQPGLVELRSGADGTTLGRVAGALAGDAFGAAIAGPGDVNLDGVPDLLIGAPLTDVGGTNGGLVVLVSGDDHSVLDFFKGSGPELRLGTSVSSVGDANGDGVPDLLMATQAPLSGGPAGAVYLRSGTNGQLLELWTGSPGQGFGYSIAGPGDVDGDGFADVALTVPMSTPDVRIYSGATGQLIRSHVAFARDVRAAGDFDGDGTPDVVALANYFLDGTGRVISGATAATLLNFGDGGNWVLGPFGEAADALGDVDGDGVTDFILGEVFSEVAGRARVYSGADATQLYVVNEYTGKDIGPVFGAGEFGARVAPLGDVDGDGAPDFVVSEPEGVIAFSGFVNAFDVIPEGWVPGPVMPDLFAGSPLSPGSKLELIVKPLSPAQPVLLLVGAAQASVPFKGGVLVPAPLVALGPFLANEPAALRLAGHWPAGAPAGLSLVLQAWAPDAAMPQGWAATNGVLGSSID